MENEQQLLTGIELRKAVLGKLGWRVEKRLSGLIVIFDPQGKHITSEDVNTDFDTVEQAWGLTPAVESSVDAALRWLKLPDGLYWGLETPIDSNAHAYVSILDVDAEMVEDTSGQYMNVPLARANHPSLAVAMCQAYLAWKAGA